MKSREQFLVYKLTLKRLLTRKSFWILLILLPILLVGISKLEQGNEETLKAVVYCREERLIPLLEDLENPCFYFVDTEEELKRQVLTGKAECGYVIPEDLLEAFEQEDWYWKVEVYEGSHSMFTKLINEVLFSRVYELVSVDWYEAFVEDTLVTDVTNIPEEIQKKLSQILANEETFRVQTIRLTKGAEIGEPDEGYVETGEKGSFGTGRISAKGVVAIMLYLMSLLAIMDVVKDREKRHFKVGVQLPASFWTIFHPVMLVGVSGFFSLLLTGCLVSGKVSGDFYRILLDITAYIGLLLVTVAYALMLSFFVRKSNWMYGLTPVLFAAGLVCCPVFVDLGAVFPIFHWIKWLFPFAFYL